MAQKRTDIHRPSEIIPEDYEFVSFDYYGSADVFELLMLAEERKAFREHRKMTGGKMSNHEHGGSCHCCGASANYVSRFYHQKTNTYVTIGHICSEKLHISQGGENSFRKNIKDFLKNQAGKKKAKLLLEQLGLEQAWKIWEDFNSDMLYQERIVADLVNKLVRYGALSEKQEKFLKNLLEQINNREVLAAKRAAEKEAAAPCPNGRFAFSGVIVSLKEQDNLYARSRWATTITKMVVKHDTGYVVWGTLPNSLYQSVEGPLRDLIGKRVEFTATFKQSDKDTKFGFFSRPTKAKVVGEVVSPKEENPKV